MAYYQHIIFLALNLPTEINTFVCHDSAFVIEEYFPQISLDSIYLASRMHD